VSYAIAAAGTGGHVFPGLAVGEALVESGVPRAEIVFLGGSRLEARVYPEAGFTFLQLELAGLKRGFTPSNLILPWVVLAAARRVASHLTSRAVRVLLAMGGYVSVPAGLGARRVGVPLYLAEQNAEAGLANRLMARFACRVFGSFPETSGLPRAEWTGNPIRRSLTDFSREDIRTEALAGYGLSKGLPVLGVFGGSLGAGAINRAVADLVCSWGGPPMQVLHLAGTTNLDPLLAPMGEPRIFWKVVGFEPEMARFYAASDLVVARAGGAVAELTATATPAILIPGGFGSGAHQKANAERLASAGAALVLAESELGSLPGLVAELISDKGRLAEMAAGARKLARPHAADEIAGVLRAAHV
jgi:undecaprenyldiphospho-muramoylpentapeptide beta-N-acetylglucosaminyltransferase